MISVSITLEQLITAIAQLQPDERAQVARALIQAKLRDCYARLTPTDKANLFGIFLNMQHFSVTDLQNAHSEALHRATVEPVVITTTSQSNYVMMSVENYEQLVNRLTVLEDLIAAQQAQMALATSRMVGTETFTAELKRLAMLDDKD